MFWLLSASLPSGVQLFLFIYRFKFRDVFVHTFCGFSLKLVATQIKGVTQHWLSLSLYMVRLGHISLQSLEEELHLNVLKRVFSEFSQSYCNFCSKGVNTPSLSTALLSQLQVAFKPVEEWMRREREALTLFSTWGVLYGDRSHFCSAALQQVSGGKWLFLQAQTSVTALEAHSWTTNFCQLARKWGKLRCHPAQPSAWLAGPSAPSSFHASKLGRGGLT